MVAISLMIEGQNGLSWPIWRRLVADTERLGFAGLFRSDHFTNSRPPDRDSLEMIVSLAYLADHTQRLHFGPLVAPLSFRDPTLLARQAAALDDLSGGRMVLGVGAGWQEREHTLFGHDLSDIPTRMARFEEGLEVLTRLLRSDAPVTFDGRFYHLRGATLLPRPQRPGGPPLLIGGNGPRRTLPLAARYADVWNAVALTPEEFRERSAQLDVLLTAAGRPASAVRRTLMINLTFAPTMEALDRRLRGRHSDLAGQPLEAIVRQLNASGGTITGTAETVLARIQDYATAGVEELMLQWLELDALDDLAAFAEQALPRIQGD